MPWHLGIDPGRDGAATLLAPDGVAEVLWSWRTSAKNERGESHINLRVAQQVEDHVQVLSFRVPGAYALGVMLVAQVLAVTGGEPCALAHEGVWTPRGKMTSIGSALQLALWTGRLIGPVEAGCGREAEVYQPSHWRKVSGVGNQKGHKERAVKVIPETLAGFAELNAATGRVKSSTHEVEAGGVARCLFLSSGSERSSVAVSKKSSKPSACPSAEGRGPRARRAARPSADPKTGEAP